MNSLRQIPLHMLLLAGLIGELTAAEAKKVPVAPAAKSAAAASAPGYAGLNVIPRTAEPLAGLADGVGLRVNFVDPAGPSAGKVEEGDVLTRLDDQILFHPDQFRALVRMRAAGDQVKLTLVRGTAPRVVEVKLGARPLSKSLTDGPVVAKGPAGSGLRSAPGLALPEITINGQKIEIDPAAPQLGADLSQRLADAMRRTERSDVDTQRGAGTSKSFSFGFSSGLSSASSSVASDSEGTVSLEEKEGKKHAVVKDTGGKVIFEGEVTTEEQRKAMPEAARRRLKLVEGNSFSIPGFGAPDKAPAPEPKKADARKGA